MARKPVSPVSLLALLRRRPALLLLFALAFGGWYANEVLYERPAHAFQGLPLAQQWQPATWTRVLRNDAFMLGYSDLRGNPLWVTYELHAIPADAAHHARPKGFERDWRALNAVGPEDYTDSGYDRGHMAPNYAISRLYGRAAQRQTFLMTNITPQRPNLNRKVWQRLEEVEADVFAPRFKDVWVITGPVFDRNPQRLPRSLLVEIPDACYKIFAAPGAGPGGEPLLLAFIIPQDVKGDEPLDRFVTSVDEVEARTGLDFFPALNDAAERRAEAEVNPPAWQLQQVARLPARY